MNNSTQELLQIARKKLANARYSVEQREQTLRLLNLLLEVASDGRKTEESARATVKIIANITSHHNLLAVIQQQAAELDALKRLSTTLTSSLEMNAVLERVVSEALPLIKNAHDVHIFHYRDGVLHFGASLEAGGQRNQIFSMPRPNGLTYSAARRKQTIIVEDLSVDPEFANPSSPWQGSIISIPLKMDETVIGVMNMARKSTGPFSQSELRLLDLLAGQASVAIINARMHQMMTNEAMSDALTGLPNRRALDARLENEVNRSTRYQHQFAVLMMDLDGFKSINDTYGHDIGDRVLRQFAQTLTEVRRSSDFLARYGGDELTMILPETDHRAAVQVAERIRQRMAVFEPDIPGGAKPRLGVSGGIGCFPTDATTASNLLRAADEALYYAKQNARGRFVSTRQFTRELKPKEDQG